MGVCSVYSTILASIILLIILEDRRGYLHPQQTMSHCMKVILHICRILKSSVTLCEKRVPNWIHENECGLYIYLK